MALLPGFSSTIDDDQAKVFGAEKKVAKKPRKPVVPDRPPKAWRDPTNGELIIDVPYHPAFNAAIKAAVPSNRRLWNEHTDGRKGGVWLVVASEALPVEDLLESIYPDIVIDYQGWNPANDLLVDGDRMIVTEDPPF
jgi:hypothetical protein